MKTNNMDSKPLLSFEFASSMGEIQPFTFSEPLKVIAAYTVEEVVPSLHAVQKAVNDGYYAAGFLSYEAAPAFDAAYKVHDGNTTPLLWFGIFSEPELKSIRSNGVYQLSEWIPSVQMEEYKEAIMSIKRAIELGNTYQTNYTIRLNAKFTGDDIAFFEQLKRAQASNYCAYINTGEHRILSASPELFFHLDGQHITTRPMKGTAKRGKTVEEDRMIIGDLYESEKERAENVMIVDLLRNDLGMIAENNTVNVPKLFEIEKYPTVHQMTSTITAKLPENTQIVDVFKVLFPCGSITGAPKISTMDLIANLEMTHRGVYCGAIGYITPENEAIFNVPIRTVVIEQSTGSATYGVGGGITWDSTSEGEYLEVLSKASLLQENRPEFELLESILLKDGDYFLLNEHVNRLKNAAEYFNFPMDEKYVRQALVDFSKDKGKGDFKIRLLLAKNGEIIVEGQPITELNMPLKIAVANHPVDKTNPFLYHKTTNRNVYSQFNNNDPQIIDVLLWNDDGMITEFINGNIVLEIDGRLWTPPIKCGLLAGTFREVLLSKGEIFERELTVEDLKTCTKVWFINSVRKWVEVQVV